MNIETRVNIKDLDSGSVRQLEILAEKASLFSNSKREEYVGKAFKYVNTNIIGEQGKYKQMYIRLFYDMLHEFDISHKNHVENHNI